MATVILPSLMRDATGGQLTLEVEGRTVRQVLTALTERYPALKERLWDEEGSLAPYLAVVVDGVEANDLYHEVGERSEVVIIPAIGGGREERASTSWQAERPPQQRSTPARQHPTLGIY